jgi:hypothetical protein
MIFGEDIAFSRENREWNGERPGHLLECLTIALRLLTPRQFEEFHSGYTVEFNGVGEELEALSGRSQRWYDQPGNIERCDKALNKTIGLIIAILDLVDRV